MAQASAAEVGDWLRKLRRVTSDGSHAHTSESLAELVDMLAAERMPAAAFCLESLRAIAGANKYFPDYSDLVKGLQRWWSENRPAAAPPLGGAAVGLDLDAGELSWLRYWDRKRGEGFPAVAGWRSGRAAAASLIRSQAPRAWAAICKAEGIAIETYEPPSAEAVREVAAKLAAHDAAAGMRLEAQLAALPAAPDRPPARLPPDLLRASYAAAGIKRPGPVGAEAED